jgi:transposase
VDDLISPSSRTGTEDHLALNASTGTPVGEAGGELIGDVADISRFASRGHFASWNGTAPLDVSSGDQNRHRLSRAGNRRINRALHIMAVVQLRNDTEGRAYYCSANCSPATRTRVSI